MVRYFHLFKSFPVCYDAHSKDFNVVSGREVADFLEFLCLLYDPVNVNNLISGSSAFSKPRLDV